MNIETLNQVEILTELEKQFGNDQDLGKNYRNVIITKFKRFDDYCKEYPNDFELGKFLRKKIKN